MPPQACCCPLHPHPCPAGAPSPPPCTAALQVAETFAMAAGEGGPPLAQVARLDTCVTLVDAANLLANMWVLVVQGFRHAAEGCPRRALQGGGGGAGY